MKLNRPSVDERTKAFDCLVEQERTLLHNKGHDYTAGQGNKDAYHNFRQVAALLKGCPITPYTVAMVYAMKHLFSLLTFCKTGRQESGEGLEGRHSDLRNYGFILNELVPDHVNHFGEEEEGDEDHFRRLNPYGQPSGSGPLGGKAVLLREEAERMVEGLPPMKGPIRDEREEDDWSLVDAFLTVAENPEDVEDDFEREWFDRIELHHGKEEEDGKRRALDNINRELDRPEEVPDYAEKTCLWPM